MCRPFGPAYQPIYYCRVVFFNAARARRAIVAARLISTSRLRSCRHTRVINHDRTDERDKVEGRVVGLRQPGRDKSNHKVNETLDERRSSRKGEAQH